MPSDQELADAVEGVLSGQRRCTLCGKWAEPNSFDDVEWRPGDPRFCGRCWGELMSPGTCELVIE